MKKKRAFPVVDLFAGPGGLGEGFLSAFTKTGGPVFQDTVSIERDPSSHQTLTLRHFLRSFGPKGFPDEYYRYLEGQISRDELYEAYPENYTHAEQSSLQISLGEDSHNQVKEIINDRLKDQKKWVLIGGPPCQAYSLVGRSRMMNRPDFEQDERHFLYREYLKIIADHSPPVFVMENVKGLLSAKVNGEPVITRILADLARPRKALSGKGKLAYRLYSLSKAGDMTEGADPRDFLVKAEEYGVPQARHRMFIVGIRSDIDTVPDQLKESEAPSVQQVIGTLPKVRSGLSKGDSAEAWREVISNFNVDALESGLTGVEKGEAVTAEVKSVLAAANTLPKERISTRPPAKSNLDFPVLETYQDDQLTVLTGHEARGHMPSDHHRYLFASAFAARAGRSPKLSDFPDFLLPRHKNVAEGQAGKMFSDRFRVQAAGQVSTTVTSHISKDGHYFIHYDPYQCRSLTVREAARLQTFPDNYHFEGPRTSQYHQIGNAVPAFLATQIAEIVAKILKQMSE